MSVTHGYSATGVTQTAGRREGRMEARAPTLGWPFAIEGEVRHGRKLGRKLGFPTANVSIEGRAAPPFGVYACRTHLPDGRVMPGVANIGVNPTIEGRTDPVLEVWLFDFDEDLYDQVIATELLHFLRPEAKFADLQSLTAQVLADAEAARKLLEA